MSVSPLRLDKALTDGYVLTKCFIGSGEHKGPPQGYKWLILSGKIYHVTGSNTQIYIYNRRDQYSSHFVKDRDILAYVAAADPTSANISLFNTIALKGQSNFCIFVMSDTESIYLSGDADMELLLTVLEWKA